MVQENKELMSLLKAPNEDEEDIEFPEYSADIESFIQELKDFGVV